VRLRDYKVTIVGMGRTALALAELVRREGGAPFVTDAASGQRLEPFREELEKRGVPYECGGHTQAAFKDARYVIPSPGVSPHIEPIARAHDQGADLLGEMEFAWRHCRSRILAVTGTNGKTTTTALLRALLEAAGHSVLLAGNNDLPFSAAVLAEPAPAHIVLEVSSYQLEMARHFRPWIACVLNVSPDHLERHKSIEAYAKVKARIHARQRAGDIAVVNADDPWTRDMAIPEGVTTWPFSLAQPHEPGLWVDGDTIRAGNTAVAHRADTQLPGRHNLQNVLAALTMMRAGRFDWGKTIEALRDFRGVEHRIEHVADIAGVPFYNDSKSTNLESLKAALESFDAPVVLIAGGRGKGADYRTLRRLVGARVKALIVLGEDAPRLEQAYGDLAPTQRAADMDDAVARAAACAQPGDVVLLSPACASFDMYRDFEERGQVFKKCVVARAEASAPGLVEGQKR